MTKKKSSHKCNKEFAAGGDFQDVYRGTTSIYVMERDGFADFFVGDYEIDARAETWKEQLRANRQRSEREDEAAPKLPSASLHDRVLIAFGPEVSPQQAIAALERAIQSITNDGLLTGTDLEGNIAWEQLKEDDKV